MVPWQLHGAAAPSAGCAVELGVLDGWLERVAHSGGSEGIIPHHPATILLNRYVRQHNRDHQKAAAFVRPAAT